MLEQRNHARVKTRLAVQLEAGRGVARDLSAGGIYFVTEVPLKVGEPLSFRLEFPKPLGICAACSARILRVEKRGKLKGVAASINRITLYAPAGKA